MSRPTKTCPSCKGDLKVRVQIYGDDNAMAGDQYHEEWISCPQCKGLGVVPVSDSELLDLMWRKIEIIEERGAWDPR